MKKTTVILTVLLAVAAFLPNCAGAPEKKTRDNTGTAPKGSETPEWVYDKEKAYPSSEWVAVTGHGASRKEAENAALNALARTFKTDIVSLTESNQRFSKIVNEAAGKKSVVFNDSKDFYNQVTTGSSVNALIGVEIGTFHQADGDTWYANARMNRRDCAARYAGMVRENEAVISGLLSRAEALESRRGFEAYAALHYAALIAQVTDNFQNILEVLDPSAVNRRPCYGGAAAIKTRMLALASGITIGISVDAEDRQEAHIIRGALGSYFTGLGFKVSERTTGGYTLAVHASFEAVDTTRVKSCRWFLDAALETREGDTLFSYTGHDRAAHLIDKEARRLALRDMEKSIKEGDFAVSFDAWLGSLLE
jgi:hypothetical protein